MVIRLATAAPYVLPAKLQLAWLSSQGDKTVEFATRTAVWYSATLPVVPLRWVLVRDPYAKDSPTFSDTMALVRRWILGAGIFAGRSQKPIR